MGLFSIFEILINFVQYLGIITSVDIDWPESWEYYLRYLRYLRFDFMIPIPELHIPPVDFRAQHILLTNGFPLLISLILLIFFKTFDVVIWYSAFLFSIGVFLAGLVTKVLPKSAGFTNDANGADFYLIAGGSGIGFLLLVMAMQSLCAGRKRRRVYPQGDVNDPEGISSAMSVVSGDDDSDGSRPNLNRISRGNQYKPKRFWKMSRNFIIAALAIYLGLIMCSYVSLKPYLAMLNFYASMEDVLRSAGPIVGLTMLTIGGLMVYNWLSNLFAPTRRINTDLNAFFRKNFLKMILLILTVMYIPITQSLFSSLNCKPYTCFEGTEFPVMDYGFTAESIIKTFAANKTGNGVCNNCNFDMSVCPIYDRLCPQTQDLRLIADPSVSCLSEMYPFYMPGTMLMFFAFTLGTPWLFYKVIYICKRYISEIPAKGNEHEKWKMQVYLSRNSCRSLYADFEFRWRYYRLILLIQKLIIVAIFIYGVSAPIVLVFSMALSHTSFALLSIYSRPYSHQMENLLAMSCLLINAANAACAFVITIGYSIPDMVIGPIALMNGVLPVAFVIGAMVFGAQQDKILRKEAKAILKEADGDLDEEEDNHGRRKSNVMRKKTAEFIKNLDQQLNTELLKTIVNFFLILGVAAFLSICCILIGMLYMSSSTRILRATYPENTDISRRDYEFAGYSSWSAFTSHCCCENHKEEVDTNGQLVELWKCMLESNGKTEFAYKRRLRVDPKYGDGRVLRPYCGTKFTSKVCRLPFANDAGVFQVEACSNTTAISQDVAQRLW